MNIIRQAGASIGTAILIVVLSSRINHELAHIAGVRPDGFASLHTIPANLASQVRLAAYDPDQNASAPNGWHRDFADARQRLREWVATSGTKLDHDRPIRRHHPRRGARPSPSASRRCTGY